MEIKLGDYSLRVVDPMNFGVEKLMVVKEGKLKGKTYIDSINYFPKLDQAVSYLLDKVMLKDFKEANDLDQLRELIGQCREDIINQVRGLKNA